MTSSIKDLSILKGDNQALLEPKQINSQTTQKEDFRTINKEDKKLLKEDKKSSLMKKEKNKGARPKRKEEPSGPENQLDKSRPPSRGRMREIPLSPLRTRRPSSAGSTASSSSSLYQQYSPVLPHRIVTPNSDYSENGIKSPGSSARSNTSSLALTTQNSMMSTRAPIQSNLDAVMLDAFYRHEQEVQKRLKEKIEEQQEEEQLRVWHWNEASRARAMKWHIEKGNQRILLKQMEIEKMKRMKDNNSQKEYQASETSLKTNDEARRERLALTEKELQRIRQKKIRRELDRQIADKIFSEIRNRKSELEQESKLVARVNQEMEREKAERKRMKKMKANELQAAWTDQLYMSRETIDPRLANKVISSLSGGSSLNGDLDSFRSVDLSY